MSYLLGLVKDMVLKNLHHFTPYFIWFNVYERYRVRYPNHIYYVMAKVAYDLNNRELIDGFEEYLKSNEPRISPPYIYSLYKYISLSELVKGMIPYSLVTFSGTIIAGRDQPYPLVGKRVEPHSNLNLPIKSFATPRCSIVGPVNKYNINLFKYLIDTCSTPLTRLNSLMPDDKSFEVALLYKVSRFSNKEEDQRLIECLLLVNSIEGLVKDILNYITYLMVETSITY